MRMQYCSDLHLEYERNNRYVSANLLKVSGEILILAGDIVPLHDEHMNSPFFRFIAENYQQVYWVPGNHEYYYHDIAGYGSSMNIEIHPRIRIVNNVAVEYAGVQLIFSTMWSKISPANERLIEQGMADFGCITYKSKKFRASDFNRLHEEGLDFLNKVVQQQQRPFIVVTHHLPSPCVVHAFIKSARSMRLFVLNKLNLWKEAMPVSGFMDTATATSPLFKLATQYLLTNQLGYVDLNEHGAYRRDAYLSV
ncbi:MAG: metallophosphoesterase [Cyclobacteriaceae bacterium]|nr:metallophosphoesterase [Cyclobacteriaceae bacterium]